MVNAGLVTAGVGWLGAPPTFRDRVVVVAPHPDDEVFAAAGIMRWLDGLGVPISIVGVTDGEASHAASTRISPAELVRLRADERRTALAVLGLGHVPVHRLGFRDADVAGSEGELSARLRGLVDADTTLILPSVHDGHPDHEASARAARVAATECGAQCYETPIWARVRGTITAAPHVLELGGFGARKRRAAECFVSQTVAVGPDAVDGPVVHPPELDALTTTTELLGP